MRRDDPVKPRVSVLVPFHPDRLTGYHRYKAWRWLENRWRAWMEAQQGSTGTWVELIVSDVPFFEGRPGRFRRVEALNRAADKAQGRVLVIADADVAFQGWWLDEAIRLVQTGVQRWVLPAEARSFTEEATKELLDRPPSIEWLAGDVESITAFSWSRLMVLPAEAFWRVGGFDPRHDGWGEEDVCFGVAVETLWGPHFRLPGASVHLWHPAAQEDTYGQPGFEASRALADRYRAAAGDPDAMAALVAEHAAVAR